MKNVGVYHHEDHTTRYRQVERFHSQDQPEMKIDNISKTTKVLKDIPVPPDQRQKGAASCRACGTHITFKKLENGKSVAIADDSSPHRCREWKYWRADEG